jgi:ATP-dependent Lon protease
VEKALADYDKKIFLVTQRNPEDEKPQQEDLFDVGVVCKILQLLRLPDGTIKVLFEGRDRAAWEGEDPLFDESGNFPIVSVQVMEEEIATGAEVDTLVSMVHEAVNTFGKKNKNLSKETIKAITGIYDPGHLADMIIPHLKVDFSQKQEALEHLNP